MVSSSQSSGDDSRPSRGCSGLGPAEACHPPIGLGSDRKDPVRLVFGWPQFGLMDGPLVPKIGHRRKNMGGADRCENDYRLNDFNENLASRF